MQYGAPVVAADITVLKEVLQNAAYFADPYDIKSMADALIKVITNKKLRANLTKQGYQIVQPLSWLHTAHQTTQVYCC